MSDESRSRSPYLRVRVDVGFGIPPVRHRSGLTKLRHDVARSHDVMHCEAEPATDRVFSREALVIDARVRARRQYFAAS